MSIPNLSVEVEEMDSLLASYSAQINYTFPNMSSHNFTAGKVKFNAAGMAGIINIANKTLDAIFPKYDQYLGYALNIDDMLDLSELDYKALIVENKGPLAFIVCTLIFGILFTLIGIGWCFKRCFCRDKGCCSKMTREQVQASKTVDKHDKCKRTTCGMLFAALVIMFTFGLVCCFVTNELMKTNVKNLPRHVDDALVDTQLYLNASKKQIDVLLIENYGLLASKFEDSLHRSGEIIKNGLSQLTGAQALNNLTDVVDTVENVRRSLDLVEKASVRLKLKAQQLQSGLNKSKNSLLQLLEKCDAPRCLELRDTPEIRSLRVENDFQNIPNMTEILTELQNFFGSNVRESLSKGKKEFDKLSISIKTAVDPYIPRVKDSIAGTGEYLKAIATNLTNALDSVPIADTREDLAEKEEILTKLIPYWYYAMLLICVSLAFIFSLMTFGIFIGFCGKQPGSEYSNECCSRKTGSSFINWGIFFIFFTILALSIVMLVHFIIAGVGGQIVCEAINELDNRTESALRVPKLRVQNDRNYEVPPYSSVLYSCKNDESAYKAFNLETVYDIQQLSSLSDRIEQETRTLANKVHLSEDSTSRITFLTPEMKQQINRFANSRITKMRFEHFADQLSESVTSVDLNDVIQRLSSTLEDNGMSNDIKTQLMNEIVFLQALESQVLGKMLDDVRNSSEHLRSLSKEQKDLAARITAVVQAAELAQEALHSIGITGEVHNVAVLFFDELVNEVKVYSNFTIQKIEDEAGKCGPLYNAFNATVASVCVNILFPVGGFWFALSFLLMIFIPILISGCCLAGLYTKYKSGGYESVNYVHSSARYYQDDNTIPLSVAVNGRRHKRGGRQAHANSETRYSNNRFEDTSHKAWGASGMVFNNHHTPPASSQEQLERHGTRDEYERPPPYYYPGPAQT